LALAKSLAGIFIFSTVCRRSKTRKYSLFSLKSKSVSTVDVDAAVKKTASAEHKIDNYLFVTTGEIEGLVSEYARSFYEASGGVEIAILPGACHGGERIRRKQGTERSFFDFARCGGKRKVEGAFLRGSGRSKPALAPGTYRVRIITQFSNSSAPLKEPKTIELRDGFGGFAGGGVRSRRYALNI